MNEFRYYPLTYRSLFSMLPALAFPIGMSFILFGLWNGGRFPGGFHIVGIQTNQLFSRFGILFIILSYIPLLFFIYNIITILKVKHYLILDAYWVRIPSASWNPYITQIQFSDIQQLRVYLGRVQNRGFRKRLEITHSNGVHKIYQSWLFQGNRFDEICEIIASRSGRESPSSRTLPRR